MITTLCLKCKHHTFGNKCEAFPNGIPDEIFLEGTNNHEKPTKGQKNDLVFEKIQ